MNVLPWYKHLLIMHIFEKIMYLQDLFYTKLEAVGVNQGVVL